VLDINVTFGIQIVNFLITVLLVNYLLIRPVRGIIAQRRACRDDLQQKIETCAARTAEDAAAYEKVLGEARAECERLRRQGREEALERQNALLARANREAADHMREERERLREESRRASDALTAAVRELGDEAVARLLA
jgi:F-type H+-transporting ATPase subunit b